jgi:hypothetical protein
MEVIDLESMIADLEAGVLTRSDFGRYEWYPAAGDVCMRVLAQIDDTVPPKRPSFDPIYVKSDALSAVARLFLRSSAHAPVLTPLLARTYVGAQRAEILARHLVRRVWGPHDLIGGSRCLRYSGPWKDVVLSDREMTLQIMPIHYTEVTVRASEGARLIGALKKLFDKKTFPIAHLPMPLLIDHVPPRRAWLAKNGGMQDPLIYLTIVTGVPERDDVAHAARIFEPLWDAIREECPAHRQHWGKLMDPRLGARELREMFRASDGDDAWSRFAALRAEWDPAGTFLNQSLRRLFA